MATLHIEHPVTDLRVWRAAFDRFAEARRAAGVLGHRIQVPADDDRYVVVDLDFATVDEAERFRDFLRTTVWASPANSPALAGDPVARVLTAVDARAAS